MLSSQRKAHILKVLLREGQVVAKSLSAQWGLSEDTLRRDLRELAGQGLLQRVHGGALPVSSANVTFARRQGLATDEKVAIGRAAAAMVQAGQVVFVDGGTTAVQMAQSLDPHMQITVVTHSPSVAVALVDHSGIDVVLIGGRLYKHSLVAVGAVAAQAIAQIRADIYFMGVSGIHAHVGLSTGDMEEAAIKRALMANAAQTVVMASSEKLGVASAYVVGPISSLGTLLVSSRVPASALAAYKRQGVKILRAADPS